MESPDNFEAILIEWSELYMHNSMRNIFHFSKKSGLSMSQIGALSWLFHKGSCAISDIGDELSITSAAASQLLERLVQQGLILRSEDPTDRRMKQIVLTDKGRRALQESTTARQGWVANLAEVLSGNEKEQVAAALNILLDKAHSLNIDSN